MLTVRGTGSFVEIGGLPRGVEGWMETDIARWIGAESRRAVLSKSDDSGMSFDL